MCFLIVVTSPRDGNADGTLDFNRDVRPILSENCFACHGQDGARREAGLRLDQRESAISAGAIVPGRPDKSALLQRVSSRDDDVVMPPPQSHKRLTPEQIAMLESWVAQGATYARHWAFVSPQRSPPPSVTRRNWPRNDIDRFVLSQIESAGFEPAPEADRVTLIRRVSLDLLGLPPTPDEVDEFVDDRSPLAYEHLVDRLLESPHYGERMAMPWLDAARYADSNGFQEDGDTWQWLWRDWVIKSLNDDMPFDQFTIEQLAGDLLPEATTSQKIASAFNRNHVLNGEGGAIPEEQRFNNLFDRVDTTCTTWLGLTMACAQCHDHKYDPLTQRDYYAMLDAFNRVPEAGVPKKLSKRIFVASPVLEMPSDEQNALIRRAEAAMNEAKSRATPVVESAYNSWRRLVLADERRAGGPLPLALQPLLAIPPARRTKVQQEQFDEQLRKHFDADVKPRLCDEMPLWKHYEATRVAHEELEGGQVPRVMIMSDDNPRDTRVLDRGDYTKPVGPVVRFATPAFLPAMDASLPRNRLGFAKWLCSPDNPLTARVQVNRMWQHFFGAGIVKTPEDMGVQSEYPVHRELLDWLAVEFTECGWSQKTMHRLLVTSATYRQSSCVTSKVLAGDPENRLFCRARRLRLPAMVLRDAALAASGLLDHRIGGAPVYPYQPIGVWESLEVTQQRDFTYPTSRNADLYRRSLYTFWRRTVQPVNMFDAANRQTCSVRVATTASPLHALTTLNDVTWVEAARVLAESAMRSSSEPSQQLTFLFRRVLGRTPLPEDLESLRRMLDHQSDLYRLDAQAATDLLSVGEFQRDDSLDPIEHAALSAVCLGVMNLDEALTRE